MFLQVYEYVSKIFQNVARYYIHYGIDLYTFIPVGMVVNMLCALRSCMHQHKMFFTNLVYLTLSLQRISTVGAVAFSQQPWRGVKLTRNTHFENSLLDT